MTATAVAVAVDYVPPPPRQGIASLRARHALFAALRCAWLRAALDPAVRSASSTANLGVLLEFCRDEMGMRIKGIGSKRHFARAASRRP